MAKDVEVHGLEELQQRFEQYPMVYDKEVSQATITSMLVLQEHVPPYPPKPEGSTYRRTGTLGRSVGVSMGGGRIGFPSIFKVKKVGIFYEGHFGTNLNYAPDVIGDKSQQKEPFSAYWWRLEQVPEMAKSKLIEVFNTMVSRLARFLEGKR